MFHLSDQAFDRSWRVTQAPTYKITDPNRKRDIKQPAEKVGDKEF